MTRFAFALAAVLSVPALVFGQASQPALAPTPPMGWNSWNTFSTKIDEKLIKGVADAMVANGMRDAGYVYVNLDDGWSEKQRDGGGALVGDAKRFPAGMKALGDYIHDRGLKFGIYNCAGTQTCAGYPGGKGHEEQDAKTYASWGVDYLKYDWCHTEGMKQRDAYPTMSRALRATGRPIVFSICEWGQSKPWEWAGEFGQLWRTTGDITDIYEGKEKWSQGWKTILDQQVGRETFAGPGHWNDPDMLEVGNRRMSAAESRAHFSLWCVVAAPLIAGNDVRNMKDDVRNVLTNREVIAIDQDALGKQGTRFEQKPGREVWVKELADGGFAVCLHNTAKEAATMDLSWKDLTFLKDFHYKVRDLWAKADLGDTRDANFHGEIASHDVALFRLRPAK